MERVKCRPRDHRIKSSRKIKGKKRNEDRAAVRLFQANRLYQRRLVFRLSVVGSLLAGARCVRQRTAYKSLNLM